MSYYDDTDDISADAYATNTAAGRVPDSFAGGFPKSWVIIAITIAAIIGFIAWRKGKL